MAESKLMHDLAELAEQWRDLETPLILLLAVEDRSWSPMRGADEEDPLLEAAKMPSNGSLLPPEGGEGEVARSFCGCSSSSSPPHNRFISSRTRMKSSSATELVIEEAIERASEIARSSCLRVYKKLCQLAQQPNVNNVWHLSV